MDLSPKEKLIVAAKSGTSLASIYRFCDRERRKRMQHDVVRRIERAIAEVCQERIAAS